MNIDLMLMDLTYTSRVIHREMQSDLKKLGLYFGQPHLLHILRDKEGSTQKEIAKKMDINPATVNKMVNRMEEAGFIYRKRDENDLRVVRVYLCEKAKEMMKKIDASFKTIDKKAFNNFTKDEREAFKVMLEKVRDNLAETEEE